MKNKWNLLLFLLASTATIQLVFAQDPLGPHAKRQRKPDDYMPRTLKNLTIEGFVADSRTNKEETLQVFGDILPSRVLVRYTGSTKPIPDTKKDVLRQWARLYAGAPEFYTRPYETEMRFLEEGDEHWLAVKTELLPRLKQTLKEHDEVNLYVIRVGAALISKRWEPMLLVEDFQKPD